MSLHYTTINLRTEHSVWLDTLSLRILKKRGNSINRSACIRALIGALAASGADFSNVSTEEELSRAIARQLGAEAGNGKQKGTR